MNSYILKRKYEKIVPLATKQGDYCIILNTSNSRKSINYTDNYDEALNLYNSLSLHYSSDRVSIKNLSDEL